MLVPALAHVAVAQRLLDADGNAIDSLGTKMLDDNDTIDAKTIPVGMYVWTADARFGDVRAARPDTMQHLFQNDNQTMGKTLQYSFLGNLGSPRISRVFADNKATMLYDPYIYTRYLDYFIESADSFLYTNTFSPFTNVTYHTRGTRTDGEDRFKVYFATNVNKRLGVGFKMDYLYGRGYYANQSTSFFDATLYGSYIGGRYNAHFYVKSDHMKMAENGGLTDDAYITSPQSFSANFSTSDYPTRLSSTWNRMNLMTVYFSHRYNLGVKRTTNERGEIVREDRSGLRGMFVPTGKQLREMVSAHDSLNAPRLPELAAVADSVSDDSVKLNVTFIPITSFIHTLRLDQNMRRYVQNAYPDNYYTNEYYSSTADSTNDKTRYLSVGNLVGVELHEGFNRWAKMGMKLYARHDYRRYVMPTSATTSLTETENYFAVGAQLYKRKGAYLHYEALGEIVSSGDSWGMFNIEGRGDLNIPFRKDTLRIDAYARIANEAPSYFYRHYRSRFAWWDNSLSNVISTRIGGSLHYKRTTLSLDVQSIQNYTYFQETAAAYTASSGTTGYTYGVEVAQAGANVQVLGLTLEQGFKLGPLRWENKLTVQTSSDKDVLPLPAFTGFSNLYLKFKIAKVLDTEFGGNVTYFTEYNAPVYSPVIMQYATQSADTQTKVGNYPIINVYANFHMRNCRFYIMATHVNYSSSGGRYFLIPHNPIDPFGVNFGISWSFLN